MDRTTALSPRTRRVAAAGVLAGAVAFLAGGCTGNVAGMGGSGSNDSDPGAGGAGNGSKPPGGAGNGGPAPIGGPTASACGASTDPGFVGMRRLTRGEMNRTFRDLLGDTTDPASALPADDSVLAEQALVSTLGFEKLEIITDKLIEDAWARDAASGQPNTAKLRVCALAANDTACAKKIVATFARKAWRRPLANDELDRLYGLATAATQRGDDLATGVRVALKAALLAPDFLYRVELDAPGAPVRTLNAHELATRLSYWLWGTMPDERLARVADDGTLTKPDVLRQELARMLEDPRLGAFSESFGTFWLGLQSLAKANPDPGKFATFDEALRTSMAAETLRFFRAFLDEPRPMRDLIDADFTFTDARIDALYGLPAGGAGVDLRRVTLPSGPRRGVLTHASVLTMTSASTRTSPVKRGKWVLGNLLCTKTPPPPPGADAEPPEAMMATNERERLALHRTNPSCAACHALIDPIGLGLENFDPIGRHRTSYANGDTIDASGVLAGGKTFSGLEELRTLLKADDRVPSCFTSSLFTFAIGRQENEADECAHRAIVEALAARGSVKEFVLALAGSPAFLQRRGEPAGGSQ